jgi:O-antigen/teichoic acid export membrane protein
LRTNNSFLIFSAVAFVQKALSFILVPLYTAVVAKDDLGQASSLMSVLSIFILIVGHGQEELLVKLIFHYDDNKAQTITRFTCGIVIVVLLSILLILVGKKFALVSSSIELALMTTYIVFFPYFSLLTKVFRILRRTKQYVVFYSVIIVLQLLTFSYLYDKPSYDSLLYFLVIPQSLGGLYGIIWLSSKYLGKPYFHIFRRGFFETTSLQIHALSGWFLTGYLIFSTQQKLDSEATAFVFTIFALSNIYVFLTKTILDSFQPTLYKILQLQENSEIIKLIKTNFIVFFVLGVSFLALAEDFHQYLFPSYYGNNIAMIKLVSLSVLISGMSSMFVHVLYYIKEGSQYLRKTSLAVAVLMILLIESGVLSGSVFDLCLALLIGHSMNGILRLGVVIRKMNLKFSDLARYWQIFVALFILGLVLINEALWLDIVIIVILIVYMFKKTFYLRDYVLD